MRGNEEKETKEGRREKKENRVRGKRERGRRGDRKEIIVIKGGRKGRERERETKRNLKVITTLKKRVNFSHFKERKKER